MQFNPDRSLVFVLQGVNSKYSGGPQTSSYRLAISPNSEGPLEKVDRVVRSTVFPMISSRSLSCLQFVTRYLSRFGLVFRLISLRVVFHPHSAPRFAIPFSASISIPHFERTLITLSPALLISVCCGRTKQAPFNHIIIFRVQGGNRRGGCRFFTRFKLSQKVEPEDIHGQPEQ